LVILATRIQLCGRLVVRIDGQRLEHQLPGRQGRLAFAYLAANRMRPISRSELTEALWPDSLPGNVDASLAALISKLRRVVGATALTGRSTLDLVLPEGTLIDVEAAFEAIHRAEGAIGRGDFAAAWGPARVSLHTARRVFLPGEEAPWIEERRRGLDEVRLRALECVAGAGLGLGASELNSALRAGRALIELAPLRENGYRLLMQALAARGDSAEALVVYGILRGRLREELGVAASPATQAIYRRLLSLT
jgi:SARP family transcriptional regulator, regulator of embCAB operon